MGVSTRGKTLGARGKMHVARGKIHAAVIYRCLHLSVLNATITCQWCCSKFDEEEDLRNHIINSHDGSDPVEASQSKMKVLPMRDGKDFKCDVCSVCLPSYKSLYFHYRQAHVKKFQTMCKVCNKLFPDENAFRVHQLIHKGNCSLVCLFCPISFKSNMHLNAHLKTDHPDKKVCKCHICHKPFPDSNCLFKHMLFHASMLTSGRHYRCCICFQTYTEKTMLRVHLENSHIDQSNLNCEVCDEMQKESKDMIPHLLRHCMRINENKNTKADSRSVGKETNQNQIIREQRSLSSSGRIIRTKSSPKKYTIEHSKEGTNSKSTDGNSAILAKSNGKHAAGIKKCHALENGNKLSTNVGSVVKLVKPQANKLKPEPKRKLTAQKQKTKKSIKVATTPVKRLKIEDPTSFKNKNPIKITQKRVPKLKLNEKAIPEISSVKSRSLSFISVTSSKGTNLNKLNPISSNNQFDDLAVSSDLIQCGKGNGNMPVAKGLYRPTLTSSSNEHSNVEHSTPLTSSQNDHSMSPTSSQNDGRVGKNHKITEDSKSKEQTNHVATSVNCHPFTNMNDHDRSQVFIQEKKCFQPTIVRSTLRCTTCMVSFSSQDELLFHNSQHI